MRRLKDDWLYQWLTRITLDDGKGEVIANPEGGWTELKRQLERDLTKDQERGGILPQQLRIMFLGLSKLSWLTPSEYRRAATGGGVEALYIRTAIETAATSSSLTTKEVRSLLSSFVDIEQSNHVKTKVLSIFEIAPLIANRRSVRSALNTLRDEEVVREKPAPDRKGTLWQLDHDYIARAVVAESRAVNSLAVRLQDGLDAWNSAGSDIRQRVRSLLPLSVQANLIWAYFRHEFNYGPYRLYAAISMLRALPILVSLIGAGWLWHEESNRAMAMEIADGLTVDTQKGANGAIALWKASPTVRIRVVDLLFNSPGRLRGAGTAWVRAFISIESDAAQYLGNRIVEQLDRPNVNADTQGSLTTALVSVTERLEPTDAAKIATDLCTRLGKPDIDLGIQRSLIAALEGISAKLEPADAAKTVTCLRARLDGPNTRCRYTAFPDCCVGDHRCQAGTW